MAVKHELRRATAADCDALVTLKSEYIRSLYRGFVPQNRLKELDPTPYQSLLTTTLEAPGRQVLVLDAEGTLQGFAILGADPENAGCGMIFDAAIRPGCDLLLWDELFCQAMASLLEQGMDRIHVWVLRDNFRMRFFYEQFGFRTEGVSRTIQQEGSEIQLTSYLYRAPDKLL